MDVTFNEVPSSIEEAAERLEKELRGFSWLISIGVGAETIFIYVKSNKSNKLKELRLSGWMGYKILVRQTGTITNLNNVDSMGTISLKEFKKELGLE